MSHLPTTQFAPRLSAVVVAIALAGCHPATPSADVASAGAATAATNTAGVSADPSESATPSTTPAATTPAPAGPETAATPLPATSLPEPPTPPEATSPQAAATLVETYFALLGEGKNQDAAASWGGNTQQAADFEKQYVALGRPNVEVDAPGGMEGAAGSSYVTVPVRFQPTSVGNGRPRMGEVIVRRVNDVPGSTPAQRRWHIERIDVAMTPK